MELASGGIPSESIFMIIGSMIARNKNKLNT
jgi:hypothetical protein